MKICVYGASSRRLEAEYLSQAYDFGALAAKNGHTVIFGGGKSGVMGAAARGAHEAGGRVIAVTPRYFDRPGVLYEGCDEMIYTETMAERKTLMLETADAFAALPGGLGTYDELFETLTLKQLGRHDKAIALLNTRDCYAPFLRLMEQSAEEGFMSGRCMGLFTLCQTPAELLDSIEKYSPMTGSIDRLEEYDK